MPNLLAASPRKGRRVQVNTPGHPADDLADALELASSQRSTGEGLVGDLGSSDDSFYHGRTLSFGSAVRGG